MAWRSWPPRCPARVSRPRVRSGPAGARGAGPPAAAARRRAGRVRSCAVRHRRQQRCGLLTSEARRAGRGPRRPGARSPGRAGPRRRDRRPAVPRPGCPAGAPGSRARGTAPLRCRDGAFAGAAAGPHGLRRRRSGVRPRSGRRSPVGVAEALGQGIAQPAGCRALEIDDEPGEVTPRPARSPQVAAAARGGEQEVRPLSCQTTRSGLRPQPPCAGRPEYRTSLPGSRAPAATRPMKRRVPGLAEISPPRPGSERKPTTRRRAARRSG